MRIRWAGHVARMRENSNYVPVYCLSIALLHCCTVALSSCQCHCSTAPCFSQDAPGHGGQIDVQVLCGGFSVQFGFPLPVFLLITPDCSLLFSSDIDIAGMTPERPHFLSDRRNCRHYRRQGVSVQTLSISAD